MADGANICPCCKDIALLAENIVVCPSCEAVFHQSCWRQQGSRCSKPGCSGVLEIPDLDGIPVGTPGGRKVGQALPVRVQSGQFTTNGLHIQTSGGERTVAWTAFQFLGVGIIELDLTVETPRSAMRAMLRKLMGDQAQPNHHQRQIRETYLLDIFLENQDAPLRIDSSVVNYRSLLGEIAHQSMRNFLFLLQRIVKSTPDSRMDSSAVALLNGKRYAIKRYSSVYEFEMETNLARKRLAEQILCSSVELSTESRVAAAEWED